MACHLFNARPPSEPATVCCRLGHRDKFPCSSSEDNKILYKKWTWLIAYKVLSFVVTYMCSSTRHRTTLWYQNIHVSHHSTSNRSYGNPQYTRKIYWSVGRNTLLFKTCIPQHNYHVWASWQIHLTVNFAIIVSDNGLSCVRRQAIIQNNASLFSFATQNAFSYTLNEKNKSFITRKWT